MKTIIASIALIVAPIAAAADPNQYLCLVEQSAGLHYDQQSNAWQPRAFGVARKYILRRLNDDDRDEHKGKWWVLLKDEPEANWAFFEFGKTDPMPEAVFSIVSYSPAR